VVEKKEEGREERRNKRVEKPQKQREEDSRARSFTSK
jgi:hypothetical protein